MSLSRLVKPTVFGIVAFSCLGIFVNYLATPKLPNVPIYPNAQEVKRTAVKRDARTVPALLAEVGFVTPDQPSEVQTYYSGVLIDSGWQHNPACSSILRNRLPVATGPLAAAVDFEHRDGNYWTSVLIEQPKNNRTAVTIQTSQGLIACD